MTPATITGGQNLRIDTEAPDLAGAPGLLFATFVSGIPVYKPVLSFVYDSNGTFGLSASIPSGAPITDIAFKVYTLGSGGLTDSNETRMYFR